MEEREVIIIGSGPAGLSAAIFTKIDGWDTLVLERSWAGSQSAIAYTVSNYPGFLPGDGAVLADNMRTQVTSPPPAGVGAELRHETAISISPEDMVVKTENNGYKAKAIILAAGSVMQKLGVPGEDKFKGKGVSYYAKRDLDRFTGAHVLVVGGGNTTAKSALISRSVAKDVTLVHRRESLRTYPAMTKRLQAEGVNVMYNSEVREIKGADKVQSVTLEDSKTGERKDLPVDWVVICVGTEPDNKLAGDAGLRMDGKYVTIDDRMMTSRSGIFACGEITGCERHLVTAASQGASTGMAVSEYLALEEVKRGQLFTGAKNGKYADEYLAMK
jgi:thioredoxin reductase (NADPH)